MSGPFEREVSALGRDRSKLRAAQREWLQRRRRAWLEANGPCVKCGSWDDLEVDHIDPRAKVEHRVWSWAEARRLAELAKCQVLCRPCHWAKCFTDGSVQVSEHGMVRRYDNGCRCDECRAAKSAKRKAQRAQEKARRQTN
jgi:hypothetical protein